MYGITDYSSMPALVTNLIPLLCKVQLIPPLPARYSFSEYSPFRTMYSSTNYASVVLPC